MADVKLKDIDGVETSYTGINQISIPKATGSGDQLFIDPANLTPQLLASLDADFVAGNIKKDVDLFGLIGTLVPGGAIQLLGYSEVLDGTITPAEDTVTLTIETETAWHNYTRVPAGFIIFAQSKHQIATTNRSLVAAMRFAHPTEFRLTSPVYDFSAVLYNAANDTSSNLNSSVQYRLTGLDITKMSYGSPATSVPMNVTNDNTFEAELITNDTGKGTVYFQAGVTYRYAIFVGGET